MASPDCAARAVAGAGDFGVASGQGVACLCTRHDVIIAGASCMGLMLGVLLVQRAPWFAWGRPGRALAAVSAALAVALAAAWVGGGRAGLAVLAVAPLGYTLRRSFDV